MGPGTPGGRRPGGGAPAGGADAAGRGATATRTATAGEARRGGNPAPPRGGRPPRRGGGGGGGDVRIAGVDEAGVGPLAGPVVAAAVILPGAAWLPGLNDSKTLPPAERERLYQSILASGARIGIGLADVAGIDRVDIRPATRLAWRRAVTRLAPRPELLLVQGPHRPAAA